MEIEPTGEINICITGACGRIAYSFIPMLLGGHVLGTNTKINLRLLDIQETQELLKGLCFEIDDSAYPLLGKLEYGYNCKDMLKNAQIIIFFGGFPRQQGQSRKDLLTINGKIFKEQGEAINEVSHPDCKCIVVANPVNTLTYILKKNAPKIPAKNITALTRLDYNRAIAQLAQKGKVNVKDIANVIIWGNHSQTQFPDISHGKIKGIPIREFIKDENWLNKDFIEKNQKRGTEILNTRKASAVLSAAEATAHHIRDLQFGKKDEFVSLGCFGNGEYPISKEICFSYPVICKGNFEYEIVKNLKWDEFSQKKIEITLKELTDEANEADSVLK